MRELASSQASTIVFPLPLDRLEPLRSAHGGRADAAGDGRSAEGQPAPASTMSRAGA